MTKCSFIRGFVFVATAFALSACGGSDSSSLSISNPNFFTGQVSDGVMTGSFNSQGFTSTQVRTLVAETFDGPISGFGTQGQDSGLTAFTASCATWKSGARLVEYERTEGSNVLIEITGAVSGNILFDRIETSV
ncbi:MAG: hypothetical protein AAF922_15435 [Pseudomonadota bacterium]